MTGQELTMGCGDTMERYNDVCKPAFDRIEKKLEKIDSSLNGNGKPGIISRLNTIESTVTGTWGVLRPILIAVLTAALVGGGIMTTRPEPVSAEQIAEVVKQMLKESAK